MNDDSFRNFLKENATPVPDAPLGESSRIWRHIEDRKHRRRRAWWVLVSAMAATLALVVAVKTQKPVVVAGAEEDYLYQEWSEFSKEVDSDFDQDMAIMFNGE